ncbi:lipocalin family protein [Mucilaginibacter gotjawali]|uniref:Apolipoprotein D and lipocalin family protein n=1 Tax=Mucilaginibacter gotjawali TaxID=1550579 RepID=A0A839SQ69_9SPHI|nr:lipocalin family protein [Mucilaginibacter gotjawali]MBB3058970.1 apolipoprotein D and lipocalin family protein [Mucilaginibacter gotjawali]
MKIFCIGLAACLSLFSGGVPNKTVSKVDLKNFSGTWYSLYSIPTLFDKGSRETTTHYNLNSDGYYDVATTCRDEDNKIRTIHSKIFPDKNTRDGQMKAQFIWPIKVDYWLIDLAPDYSWAVVGHPDYRFLFIMSRKPHMDKKLYDEIVARCKAMGYPVEKLVSQQFPHALE